MTPCPCKPMDTSSGILLFTGGSIHVVKHGRYGHHTAPPGQRRMVILWTSWTRPLRRAPTLVAAAVLAGWFSDTLKSSAVHGFRPNRWVAVFAGQFAPSRAYWLIKKHSPRSQYHVVAKVMSTDLSDGMTATTVNGADVTNHDEARCDGETLIVRISRRLTLSTSSTLFCCHRCKPASSIRLAPPALIISNAAGTLECNHLVSFSGDPAVFAARTEPPHGFLPFV
jgi:hypothetical protein